MLDNTGATANLVGVTSTVTINRDLGFTNAVILTTSGVPQGVVVSFAPSAGSGTSSVARFTARGYAIPGSYPITLTGTSGGVVRTATVQLTVNAYVPGTSSAVLDVESPVTVMAGAPAGTTVPFALVRIAASPFPVTFTHSTLPAGATLAFTQANFAAGILGTIRLVAGATTVPGTYNVTISSVSSGPNSSMVMQLIVLAP